MQPFFFLCALKLIPISVYVRATSSFGLHPTACEDTAAFGHFYE